jgi:hypothetical protein
MEGEGLSIKLSAIIETETKRFLIAESKFLFTSSEEQPLWLEQEILEFINKAKVLNYIKSIQPENLLALVKQRIDDDDAVLNEVEDEQEEADDNDQENGKEDGPKKKSPFGFKSMLGHITKERPKPKRTQATPVDDPNKEDKKTSVKSDKQEQVRKTLIKSPENPNRKSTDYESPSMEQDLVQELTEEEPVVVKKYVPTNAMSAIAMAMKAHLSTSQEGLTKVETNEHAPFAARPRPLTDQKRPQSEIMAEKPSVPKRPNSVFTEFPSSNTDKEADLDLKGPLPTTEEDEQGQRVPLVAKSPSEVDSKITEDDEIGLKPEEYVAQRPPPIAKRPNSEIDSKTTEDVTQRPPPVANRPSSEYAGGLESKSSMRPYSVATEFPSNENISSPQVPVKPKRVSSTIREDPVEEPTSVTSAKPPVASPLAKPPMAAPKPLTIISPTTSHPPSSTKSQANSTTSVNLSPKKSGNEVPMTKEEMAREELANRSQQPTKQYQHVKLVPKTPNSLSFKKKENSTSGDDKALEKVFYINRESPRMVIPEFKRRRRINRCP